MEFYHCDVCEALQKIVSFHGQNSFNNNVTRPPIHLHENYLLKERDARELSIKIIAAKQPIQDLILCRYLRQRRISKNIADKYFHEVVFKNLDKEKLYKAIGFKNNGGGYELRNEYFKGSSSPKYVSYLDNKKNRINVFEGFFDFLSYQTIQQNQEQPMTNFLILNSYLYLEVMNRTVLHSKCNAPIELFFSVFESRERLSLPA